MDYLLTDGTKIVLSKEQLAVISYPITVKKALKLLK